MTKFSSVSSLGRSAYQEGIAITDNPYPPNSEESKLWIEGYDIEYEKDEREEVYSDDLPEVWKYSDAGGGW